MVNTENFSFNIIFNFNKLKSDMSGIVDFDKEDCIVRINKEENEVELVVEDIVYGFPISDYIKMKAR